MKLRIYDTDSEGVAYGDVQIQLPLDIAVELYHEPASDEWVIETQDGFDRLIEAMKLANEVHTQAVNL